MKTKHHRILSAPIAQQVPNNMIYRKWFALALGGVLFSSVLALSPSPAEAQCQQWSVGHGWRFKQGPTAVDMNLHQNGTVVTGTASHVLSVVSSGGNLLNGFNDFNEKRTVSGDVDGTVKGDQFAVIIHWDNNTTGVYNGTIGPSGRIEGTGYEQKSPSTKVNWYSETHMVCADAKVEKPTSASQQTAPATSAKPPAPNAADWVGRWDTTTDQGGHFEIVLTQDGDAITGVFRDLNGNPQYNGTLIGTLSGKTLKYRFTQLKAAGLGEFNIANAGKTMSGEGRMNDADKTRFAWWGFKTK